MPWLEGGDGDDGRDHHEGQGGVLHQGDEEKAEMSWLRGESSCIDDFFVSRDLTPVILLCLLDIY